MDPTAQWFPLLGQTIDSVMSSLTDRWVATAPGLRYRGEVLRANNYRYSYVGWITLPPRHEDELVVIDIRVLIGSGLAIEADIQGKDAVVTGLLRVENDQGGKDAVLGAAMVLESFLRVNSARMESLVLEAAADS